VPIIRILLNTAEPGEARAVLVEDGRVVEFRRERTDVATYVGSIYRGKVVNLETGIAAAFLDIGVGRNGFLHASDCAAGDNLRIEEHVALGDEVVVQVTRDAVGQKGPVLSKRIALPGRFLVFLPHADGGGISHRIEAADDRAKLRAIATELEARAGGGLIVRTASAARPREDLERDLDELQARWRDIEARTDAAPVLLHAERDLVARALRDLADGSVGEVVVDTGEAEARVRALRPDLEVVRHQGPPPLFHAYEVEGQIDTAFAREVVLPGGGSIVIDRTEALVAVDVNSGRARDAGLEETTHRVNLEAAEEIGRQLRLRDLGGVVVVDFIDASEAAHERELEQRFKEILRRDRARVRPGHMGPFGIFVLTRQRAGDGAADGRRPCSHCGGVGTEGRPAELALRIYRELLACAPRAARARVSPGLAEALHALGPGLAVEVDPGLAPGEWVVER